MTRTRSLLLTACAMLAFAGNSLLCRLALRHTAIDAASFTSVRLVAGALTLWLLLQWRPSGQAGANSQGNWISAAALCAYAAGFSWAYVHLSAATGALLLFGAVQATMVGHGLWAGERLRPLQSLGVLLTLAGLLALLLPGLAAPPLVSALLMLGAGVAWGVYSLRGKGAGDPLAVTAGNFVRAVPLALAVSAASYTHLSLDTAGLLYAVASGALASGIGYAIWYTALPTLSSTAAASVQLSVPVLAALGGIALLGESASLRLVLASVAVLGGIGLVIWQKRRV
ncbi:DMT family transporter [Rhodoferax sp. WC2427]|uniref:DMT family transporter n=1 Tax=Rhodoferax sp. WC2427 TaxID=3234144 RepID=UPI003467EC3D